MSDAKTSTERSRAFRARQSAALAEAQAMAERASFAKDVLATWVASNDGDLPRDKAIRILQILSGRGAV